MKIFKIGFSRIIFCFMAAGMLVGTMGQAEVISLKNGQKIDGKIFSKTDEKIMVDVGQGIIVSYYLDELETADPLPMTAPAPSPLSNQKEELSSGDKTVEQFSSPQLSSEIPEQLPKKNIPSPPVKKTIESQKNKTDGAIVSSVYEKQTEIAVDSAKYLDEQLKTFKDSKSETLRRFKMQFKKDFPQLYRMIKAFIKTHQQLELKSRLRPFIEIVAPITNGGITFPLVMMLTGIYLMICFPLMMIADKVGLKMESWMAFIPFLQIILFFRMADRPVWWIIFLLIPGINLIVFVILWASICEFMQKSSLWGVLLVIPVINIFVLWYLALIPSQ